MSRFAVRRSLSIPALTLALGAVFAVPAFADEPAAHALPTAEIAAPSGHDSALDHEHHVPSLADFNWYYGFLGEKAGVEPSFLYRPKGMPVPFGAMLLNSLILYYLLIRFAKKPIADALKARKVSILRGMEEAGKMKSEAEARLADYEQKLATIDEEIERVRDPCRRHIWRGVLDDPQREHDVELDHSAVHRFQVTSSSSRVNVATSQRPSSSHCLAAPSRAG